VTWFGGDRIPEAIKRINRDLVAAFRPGGALDRASEVTTNALYTSGQD
jgi:hypothetical protein